MVVHCRESYLLHSALAAAAGAPQQLTLAAAALVLAAAVGVKCWLHLRWLQQLAPTRRARLPWRHPPPRVVVQQEDEKGFWQFEACALAMHVHMRLAQPAEQQLQLGGGRF